MKKIISLLLVVALAVSVIALVGCNGNEKPDETAVLKLGVGVVSAYEEAKNADGDTNGEGEMNTTAAAVLLDAENKIVKVALDSIQVKTAWTSEGKVVPTEKFSTKYELGKDYGMAAYGTDLNGDGVVKEWNEQADAFVAAVTGKTLDEAKALIAEDGYGKEDLATAGCTMNVAEYIAAVEKAVNNAADSKATANDTLKVALSTTAENKDAAEDAEGAIEIDTAIAVAAVNAEGKVVASKTDAVIGKFTFDAKGISSLDAKAEIKTKLELGKDYGMAAYGTDLNGDGVVKEWNEQAAAFDAACEGKTADEIAALVVEGYGTEDIQTAGCTMAIADIAAAAVKAATVA